MGLRGAQFKGWTPTLGRHGNQSIGIEWKKKLNSGNSPVHTCCDTVT